MDLAELLAAGRVDEFNAARPQRGGPDLFAADLAGARIPAVDLTAANLDKADLSRADLTDATLMRARLSGADLTGARLDEAMAMKLDLREAYLGEASLRGADLTGADLTDAEAPDARMPGAVLRGAKLKRLSAPRLDLEGASLVEARAGGAELQGANLVDADLSEADLRGADLTGADLRRARLIGARLTEARLDGANLEGADLSRVDLSRASLVGARLVGARLRQADLAGAVLDGADLAGADLLDANLPDGFAGPRPAAPAIHRAIIEEPRIAVNGDAVALMWDNPAEAGDEAALCVAVGRPGEPVDVAVVDEPAQLVLAAAIAASGDGFCVLALVERPGGVVASAWRIDRRARPERWFSTRMPYALATRPVLVADPGGPLLYGIARGAAGVLVHRLGDDGLEHVGSLRLPTVRGFVSDRLPLVLGKGGVLTELSPTRAGRPLRVPADFPGRRFGVCRVTDGYLLAWAPRDGLGFRTARVAEGRSPEVVVHRRKVAIGTVDAAEAGGRPAVAFTVEPPSPELSAEAWLLDPDSGAERPVEGDRDLDPSEVRLVDLAGDLGVLVVGIDGSVQLVRPSGGPGWRLSPADVAERPGS